mgnify:CR=1 FL=1
MNSLNHLPIGTTAAFNYDVGLMGSIRKLLGLKPKLTEVSIISVNGVHAWSGLGSYTAQELSDELSTFSGIKQGDKFTIDGSPRIHTAVMGGANG